MRLALHTHSSQHRYKLYALTLLAIVVLTTKLIHSGQLQAQAAAVPVIEICYEFVEPEPEQPAEIPPLPVDEDHMTPAFVTPTHRLASSQFHPHSHYAAAPRVPNHRAVYLSANSVKDEARFKKALKNTMDRPANALIIDTKDYFVYFDADLPTAEEIGLERPFYDLAERIAEAKRHGLYVIARHVAANDPGLALRRPDTRIQNIQTGQGVGDKWVRPNHPTVLQYNREVLAAAVEAGLDEINLDYIRYPTEYPRSWIGLTGQERADQVEEFIVMAREVINANGKDTKLGLSTFAILGWNYELNLESLGQDVVRFAPLVDVISPMAYPATFTSAGYYNPKVHMGSRKYSLVKRTLLGYADILGYHKYKLRPWIQGYNVTTQDMVDQMQAVYDAGSCGFKVWSAGNYYGPTYRALDQVEIPEECL